MKEKVEKIPILKNLILFLDSIKLPKYPGFSIYDLIEIYFSGIIKGVFSFFLLCSLIYNQALRAPEIFPSNFVSSNFFVRVAV